MCRLSHGQKGRGLGDEFALTNDATSVQEIGSARALTFPDREMMGAVAARHIAEALRQKLATGGDVRMIFAAAPSQSDMLAALCGMGGIDWSRVTAFHMDDYIGLPASAPQRFSQWLRRHVFDLLPLGQVHLIEPGAAPDAEARRYEALLAQAPIDFVCLGIGVNGHIAFNDPPVADFNDSRDVKIVELDLTCRQQQVDDDCFVSIDDVPHTALTLTVPRLMRAGQLFCVVPGAAKRAAVQAALHGPVSTDCPASILRSHANCTFYLDKESNPQ